MRYALLALAATALTGTASAAHGHHRRHNHNLFKRDSPADACVCTTYVTSYLVPVTVYPEGDSTETVYAPLPTDIQASTTVYDAPEEAGTTTVVHTNIQTSTAMAYVTNDCEVPAPSTTLIEKPGVYTIPGHTLTLTATATGTYPEETVLAPGTHVYGGITTVVETSTVVTCPYVKTETEEGTTTVKVYETKYTCPGAGTYTIGAATTVVPPPNTETVAYAVPTVYHPGTYVQDEITTTITKTNVVVTCPYTSVGAAPTGAPAPAPAPAPPSEETPYNSDDDESDDEHDGDAPKPAPTKADVPVVEADKPAPTKADVPVVEADKPAPTKADVEPVKPTTTKASSTKAAATSAAPAPISPVGGSHWAITYSPYTDARGCKSASQVAADIADIASKGFKNVRIYSTDCNGLATVGDACRSHGIGIIAGIFIKGGGVSTGDEQLKDLKAWKSWDLVRALIVGNEAIFNHYCSGAELAAYIQKVRAELKGIYGGPIFTTETVDVMQANGAALCPVIDYVGVNVQPYFDGGVTGDTAGAFLKSQLKLATDVCGGKEGFVLEAGWPSKGSPNGKSVPSPEEQKKAISSYEEAAPGHVSYFTYTNDLWKDSGSLGVEQNFGCGGLF